MAAIVSKNTAEPNGESERPAEVAFAIGAMSAVSDRARPIRSNSPLLSSDHLRQLPLKFRLPCFPIRHHALKQPEEIRPVVRKSQVAKFMRNHIVDGVN